MCQERTETVADDKEVKKELVKYGKKMVQSGLVAGAGGNISARSGQNIYLKPSGYALDELTEENLTTVDIETGKVLGGLKPTSEVAMHLACYRARDDVKAVVHTHSPWASGVISSGGTIEPMFPEFIADLDRVVKIKYILPTTELLANKVGEVISDGSTVLMENHGVLAVGRTLKEAYYRSLVIEDAAKSLIAAKIMGIPRFLTPEEIEEIRKLEAVSYRRRVVRNEDLSIWSEKKR